MTKIPEIEFNDRTNESLGFEIIELDKLFSNPLFFQTVGVQHKLTFYAIIFITGDRGSHSIDFIDYSYRKGSLIFISKEQVHAFSLKTSYQGFMILFTPDFLLKSLSSSEIATFRSIYNYQLYKPVTQVNDVDYSEFLGLLEDIFDEYKRNSDTIRRNILRNYLKVLLLKSERYKTQTDQLISSQYYLEFIQFQELLKACLNREKQVQFYANEMHMSTKKLNMIIQDVVGLPAKALISKELILQIKRSLMNTSSSIKEVSYEFGFDEPTNFVKFFKKHTGQSPAVFKEAKS